jgi:hypothetical protein
LLKRPASANEIFFGPQRAENVSWNVPGPVTVQLSVAHWQMEGIVGSSVAICYLACGEWSADIVTIAEKTKSCKCLVTIPRTKFPRKRADRIRMQFFAQC